MSLHAVRGESPPLIVAIEGLDGVGKSTVVWSLASHLGAAVITSPSPRLRRLDTALVARRLDERRAFFGNLHSDAMRDARAVVATGRSVVMDGCIVGFAVRMAAESGRSATPTDLLEWVPRPDLVIHLHIREAERQRRQHLGDRTEVSAESRVDRDLVFRRRVLDGYDAAGAVPIDASGSVASVVGAIVELVDRTGRPPNRW